MKDLFIKVLEKLTTPFVSFLEITLYMVVLPSILQFLIVLEIHILLVVLVFFILAVLFGLTNDYINFKTKPRGNK